VTELSRIGVVGAGQMGCGIAHVCALAGLDVVLADVNAELLSRSLETIDANLGRQVARGRIREDEKAAALSHISTIASFDGFGDCDMVIEAATEKEDVKREVFKQLVPKLKPSALIATNTSSISITRLASATDRPGKFIGMHFMNPAPDADLHSVGEKNFEWIVEKVADLAVKKAKSAPQVPELRWSAFLNEDDKKSAKKGAAKQKDASKKKAAKVGEA